MWWFYSFVGGLFGGVYFRDKPARAKSSDMYVFELVYSQPNEVEINGIFYMRGLDYPIIATKDYLDLNTNKFIHHTKISNGAGIIIDNNSIAI
jgi:hypothetical protein